jgi:hypothetical protein
MTGRRVLSAGNCLPDYFGVNLKISMGNPVAQTNDFKPVQFWMLFLKIITEVRYFFAERKQTHEHCILSFLIFQKGCLCLMFRRALSYS